jgi:hypothetical protein
MHRSCVRENPHAGVYYALHPLANQEKYQRENSLIEGVKLDRFGLEASPHAGSLTSSLELARGRRGCRHSTEALTAH